MTINLLCIYYIIAIYYYGGYENSSRVYGTEGWDMQPPLKTGVTIDGELNNVAAHNTAWSVEIALPLAK